MSFTTSRGREVLAGLFVVLFVEAADQLLEDRAHGVVVEAGQPDVAAPVEHRVGAEVDVVGEELLDQAAEDVGIRPASESGCGT